MSDEHIPKIYEMKDRLQELVHIANTAGMYAQMELGDTNYPRFGNYVDPEIWINNELLPFFQTVRYRLTNIHQMLNSMFDKCLEGCAFDEEEDEEKEPTPEELAQQTEREEACQRRHAILDAVIDIQRYAEAGQDNLKAVLKFKDMLTTPPSKISEQIEPLVSSGGDAAGEQESAL